MDQNIYSMIADRVVTIKIMVKRKTDIGNRTPAFRTLKTGRVAVISLVPKASKALNTHPVNIVHFIRATLDMRNLT